MSSSDLLYAELLSNIRQISVVACLKSPGTGESTLRLSEDGTSVTLTHNGATQKLSLPARVAVNARKLCSANTGSTEISWRLPLFNQSPQEKDEDFSQTTIAPWAATDLSSSATLLCRRCKVDLLKPNTISTWKDLPSENWAEMMDFWHCHKPTDNEDGKDGCSDENSEQKAYGANNKFMAESRTGFVGLTYFLLSEGDCNNIKKSTTELSTMKKNQTIMCKSCSSLIGTTDYQALGLLLHKYRLSIPPSPNYSLSSFLTSQIASLIHSQAVSKFLLHASSSSPSPFRTTTIHAWVFTPKMTYSLSSPTSTKSSQVAMKLFYRIIDDDMVKEGLLDDANVENIALPEDVLKEVGYLLRASTGALPASVRKFREWDVGILDRHDGGS